MCRKVIQTQERRPPTVALSEYLAGHQHDCGSSDVSSGNAIAFVGKIATSAYVPDRVFTWLRLYHLPDSICLCRTQPAITNHFSIYRCLARGQQDEYFDWRSTPQAPLVSRNS